MRLGHGCDINITTPSGDSMLHAAIRDGHASSALFLIAYGAQANLANERLETPLHFACSSGAYDVVEALLGKRAAINAQDCELRSPIMRAIASGRKEIVRRLLDQERYDGSRVDLTLKSNKGNGALSMALEGGHLDVAEWLIAAGADIEAENEGTSVLNQCIIRGDSPSALFLLERKASVGAPIPSDTIYPPLSVCLL